MTHSIYLPDDALSMREAAELLRRHGRVVKPLTIRKWLREGRMPGIRIGDEQSRGLWYVRRSVLLSSELPVRGRPRIGAGER